MRAGEKRISLRIKERSVLVHSKEKLGIRSKQRGKKRQEKSQTSAQTGDPMRVHMHTPRTQPAVQTWICSFYFPHFLRFKKRKKIRPSIQFIVFHEKTNRHDVKRLFLLYQMDPLLILIKDKNIHSFLFIHLTFSTSHFRGKDFSIDSPKTMKKNYNKTPQ